MSRAVRASLGVLLVAILCGVTYGIVQTSFRNEWWLLLLAVLGGLVALDVRGRKSRR